MAKRSLALLLMCLGALLAMPVMAAADTQDIIQPQNETRDQGFQAGTCIAEGIAGPPPAPCSPETPTIFFNTAAGHPPIGFTQYIIEHAPFTALPSPPFPAGALSAEIPGEDIKEHTIRTLRVDLPPGLTVNPEATPRCSIEDFTAGTPGALVPTCDPASKVGVEKITLVTNRPGVEVQPGVVIPISGFVIPPTKELTEVDIYNLEPEKGEPAKFGFIVRKAIPIYLKTEVAWENDYHESFTIALPNTAEATGLSTLISRLVNFGRSGDGTYITNPTTCFNPNEGQYETLYSTWFRAESYADPVGNFPQGYTAVEAKTPKAAGSEERIQQDGCESVPFDPSVEVNPGTAAVDSPAPAVVTTKLPFNPATEGGEGQMQSHVRKAEVSLPQGMGLNPAGAQGLVACTDGQFKKGVRVYNNECPAASKIGTVEVDSPPLAKVLTGDVYVGTQNSNNPESGDLYRVLIEAKDEEEGIAARLIGRVKANNTTGQLTAEIYDDLKGQFTDQPAGLPQVPFEEIRLRFNGGSNAVLTSPPICSSESTSSFEPWARPGTSVNAKSKVTLATDPSGGACPATLAERKFAPTYKANTNSTQAGAYSPFHVRIARTDGQQELKVADITLPEGLTGKLAGIPYCPEAAIAGAAGNSGKAELATASCPSASRLGSVVTRSGTGDKPLELGGNAYLAGPYKGAPLSMVTVTSAVAGPFDLGTVVVRVALHVNPESTQVRAISDVIPDVFGGAKLDLRAIDLHIDRNQFMLNPTSCEPRASAGSINGGGANPANQAAFSTFLVNDPFQASGCDQLGFKPKLRIKLFGPTQRTKFPRLQATLTTRPGDANIARTAVKMPRSLFLEQGHIGTVCTRPQLASNTCPEASVYGSGWAKSPLLDEKLQGKVYLVSSDNELPDLVADLRGQVNIHLRGIIGNGKKGGGLKTVFPYVPDVPVSKFVLNMKGGKKSLLVNSVNTCEKPQRAAVNMMGQNEKKAKNNKYKLNIVSCGKKKQGGKKQAQK
jgi:hypothetical protein